MTITVNGQRMDVAPDLTGAALLAQLKLPLATAVAEVNSAIYTGEQFGSLVLHDGDTVELVTLVGGG